jgi:hypothetical protein
VKLDAVEIVERHPGLSSGVTGAMVEAAAVALGRRHVSPVDLEVTDCAIQKTVPLSWVAPNERAHLAWNDMGRTTEWAAEAIAVLSVEAMRGLVVVKRAPRGSRADYYVGRPGDSFEDAVLLEVGGTDDHSIKSLLAEKLEQAASNPDRLPALAAVVRLREPSVMIADAVRGSP